MLANNKIGVECLGELYGAIRQSIIRLGYGDEIGWQQTRNLTNLSETEFLSQYAWVVMSSGMRESVVSIKFEKVLCAFNRFKSSGDVIKNSKKYVSEARTHFNHEGKMNAIAKAAEIICSYGNFVSFRNEIERDDVKFMQKMPYMGPATSRHLAKNIGVNISKPDRHLIKLSRIAGYASVSEMCSKISEYIGEETAVIDLVLWRYATLEPSYGLWSRAMRSC